MTYPYRQNSDFYYLTGFEEPESLFILKQNKSLLIVPEKNVKKELWDGFRYGPQEAKKVFLMDQTQSLEKLDEVLKKELQGASLIFYNSIHPEFDKKIKRFKKKIKSAREFLAPFRQRKDAKELGFMKQACAISAYGHSQVAKALKPNVNERLLHGVFLKSIMEKGAAREGYQSIVACGNNATTLHYVKNNGICKKGELLLIDAGGEYSYYTADISRVYPVSGRFTKIQKKAYGLLLSLQKELIKQVKPGCSLKDLNEKMREGIVSILLELKILKGKEQSLFEQGKYLDYCPHFVSHLLGMDVHDSRSSRKESPVLKPNMVITVEPGLYFSKKDQKVDAGLRGVGLRIEDNILVTQTGSVNLTKQTPKEVEEVEALCQSS